MLAWCLAWYAGWSPNQAADVQCTAVLSFCNRQQMEDAGHGHHPKDMLEAIEKAWQVQFPDGSDPGIEFMDHLWKPLKCNYRPLCFYLANEVAAVLKHVLMIASGFSCYSHGGFTYYTYDMNTPQQVAR